MDKEGRKKYVCRVCIPPCELRIAKEPVVCPHGSACGIPIRPDWRETTSGPPKIHYSKNPCHFCTENSETTDDPKEVTCRFCQGKMRIIDKCDQRFYHRFFGGDK